MNRFVAPKGRAVSAQGNALVVLHIFGLLLAYRFKWMIIATLLLDAGERSESRE